MNQACKVRTSRAILSAIAPLNLGFGLVIGLSLIPTPHFLVQTFFIGLDMVMTVVLLGGVFEKRRKYVTVFLYVSTVSLAVETAAFGVFKFTEIKPEDRGFSVGVFVVRWMLQLAAFWAYFNIGNDVPEAVNDEKVELKV